MSEPVLPSPPPPSGTFWQQLHQGGLQRIAVALQHKDFRYFLIGSFLSNIGTWMQAVAQSWLVLQLTNSAFFLGLDGFANTLPISLFAFWGGVVADRFDRRRLLLGTQWIQLVLAVLLAVLTQTHVIRVWQVIGFSFLTGLTQSVAWPAYQTVMANLAAREHLPNAIALNSTQFNLARTVGPLLGALALSLFGTAGCFYANAISFIAVILVLNRIRLRKDPARREPIPGGFLNSFQEGFKFIGIERSIFWILSILAASSILGVPLVTMLPVFARDILKIGASGLGLLTGAFGAGAVFAGLTVALVGDFTYKGRFVMRAAFLFVVGMLGFVCTRNVLVSVLCLFVTGFAMVGVASVINTIIQQSVPDHLRGRAMSAFVFSFGGCMPIGNLLAGCMAKAWGAPRALFIQGVCFGLFTLFVKLSHPEIDRLS